MFIKKTLALNGTLRWAELWGVITVLLYAGPFALFDVYSCPKGLVEGFFIF